MGNLKAKVPTLYVDFSRGIQRLNPKWPPKLQFSDNSPNTVKIKIR